MTDETDTFFDVTQSCPKRCTRKPSRDLRREREEYSDCGHALGDGSRENREALDRSYIETAWRERPPVGAIETDLVDQMKPALNNLDAQANKQAGLLASLSGAVAGQQNQLTQLQQSGAGALKAVSESRQVLDTLVATSDQQRKMLNTHALQLSELRGELGEQRDAIGKLYSGIRRCLAVAVVAALLSLGTLVAVLLT